MTNAKGVSRGLNPTAIKCYEESKVYKEQFLFMAICPDYDRALLGSEEKMSLEDFDRISYLMQGLGFESLYSYFLMQHLSLLKELGGQIEDEIAASANLEKEIEKAEYWCEDFLGQLPSEKMRYFIDKVLHE